MTFNIVADPERARLITLLYEGYEVSLDELLKELQVNPKKLESLLEATKGLWEIPRPKMYRLTERGNITYGIIKSRNIEIKKVAKKMEKKQSPLSKLLGSIKDEVSRRFL